MRAAQFEAIALQGPQGLLDTLRLDSSLEGAPHGLALIAHPNPLQGGSNTNKVVHTLAKVLSRRGYICYCPNLRGVGQSAGEHDHGVGEVDDMAAVLAQAQTAHPGLPLVLAGFSFGSYVQAQLCERLGGQVQQLILVGPACSKWAYPNVPAHTLVIHGELDEVAPLHAVFDWARPQTLPISVLPGAGHFFHGKLTALAEMVQRGLLR